MKDNLKIAFALCVVLASIAAIVIHTHPSQVTLPAPALAADAYPLYSGAQWGAAYPQTLQLGTTTLHGSEADAAPVQNIRDLGIVFAPFEAYYRDKLMHLGWSLDLSLQANGPGSGIDVYRKGSTLIALEYQTIFTQGGTSSPEQCPCSITLSLFSSGQ